MDNDDVEVVALVDPSETRRLERGRDWPGAATFSSIDELASSGLAIDTVEVLLPIAFTSRASWSASRTGGT